MAASNLYVAIDDVGTRSLICAYLCTLAVKHRLNIESYYDTDGL